MSPWRMAQPAIAGVLFYAMVFFFLKTLRDSFFLGSRPDLRFESHLLLTEILQRPVAMADDTLKEGIQVSHQMPLPLTNMRRSIKSAS
ncbi:hypothetical protein QQP08_016325 [Theobroma cacao]|nr:hypothetical protein QQP08_016325 [Theobroma cacao]